MTVQVVGTVAFDAVARVDRFPAPDTTAGVLALSHEPGGTAGNVARALARLGARPRLVAAVGSDFAGSAYERALLADGADLSSLHRASGASAFAYVATDREGRQATYFYPGASRELAKAEAPPAEFAHFAAGEVSAYPPFMERCRVVSFDPGQEVFHRDLEEVRACLPFVDFLFLNRHETGRLVQAWGLAGPRDLLRGRLRAVFETRGERGQVVHAREGTFEVPAVPARLVDPTGAGDAHRAGCAFALSRGASLLEAARLGAVVASFAIEAMGAQGSLPTLADARRRYAETFAEWPSRFG